MSENRHGGFHLLTVVTPVVAPVVIPVVFRNEVDVVENDAAEMESGDCFEKRGVHEEAFVERIIGVRVMFPRTPAVVADFAVVIVVVALVTVVVVVVVVLLWVIVEGFLLSL